LGATITVAAAGAITMVRFMVDFQLDQVLELETPCLISPRRCCAAAVRIAAAARPASPDMVNSTIRTRSARWVTESSSGAISRVAATVESLRDLRVSCAHWMKWASKSEILKT
jgi:hypothetical protein